MPGLLESTIPLLFTYLLASYTRNWFMFQNLVAIWAVKVLSNFAYDSSFDPDYEESQPASLELAHSRTLLGFWLPLAIEVAFPVAHFGLFGDYAALAHYTFVLVALSCLIQSFR